MAKKWIQSAHLKKGAFTAWCKRHGFKGVTQKCIAMGKRSKDATVRHRANLARTFIILSHRRGNALRK